MKIFSTIDQAKTAVAPLLSKFAASQNKGQDANALALSSYLRGFNDAGAISQALQIELKSVYGKTLIYPANQAAKLIAKIAGTKTLSSQQIAWAKELGFEVQEVAAYQLKVAA